VTNGLSRSENRSLEPVGIWFFQPGRQVVELRSRALHQGSCLPPRLWREVYTSVPVVAANRSATPGRHELARYITRAWEQGAKVLRYLPRLAFEVRNARSGVVVSAVFASLIRMQRESLQLTHPDHQRLAVAGHPVISPGPRNGAP
jgi:hypothetical protein